MSFELAEPITPESGESAREFTDRLEGIYRTNLARAHKLRRQIES